VRKKLFVLFLAVIFVLPLILYAVPQGDIKVKKIGNKKPATVYNHQKHAAKGVKACKTCHHKGKVSDSCSKCHKDAAGMNALHKNCKGCHVKMKTGPKSCKDCHKG
jgi:nitrate/TMAO reductase-like tetraheme cytochrome c subunit